MSPPSMVVLIPVFNDPAGITRSLDSLLAAERPADMTTLVVDDGSDPPVDIDSSRYRAVGLVTLRLQHNQGIEAALNAGLQWARANGCAYVARLDAGDRVSEARLSMQVDYLERHPEVGIVASDVNFVAENRQFLFVFRAPREDAGIRRQMHLNCCLLHPSVMMRRRVLDEIGDYSTAYPAAEDYELFLRILQRAKAACLPLPLVTVTYSAGGISSRRRRRQLASRLRLQAKHFAPGVAESYLGVALTLLLLLIPSRLIVEAKRFVGETWM